MCSQLTNLQLVGLQLAEEVAHHLLSLRGVERVQRRPAVAVRIWARAGVVGEREVLVALHVVEALQRELDGVVLPYKASGRRHVDEQLCN